MLDARQDLPLQHALAVIKETYGDTCYYKPKPLTKFGRYDALGTSRATVQAQGGNETYLTDNLIDTITSSNAGDTGAVKVEGHTIDGSGNLIFSVQDATLNGQNKVTLATPLARATRVYNNSSTNWAGDVYVFEDDTVTGGVPDTASKLHLVGTAQANQSEKCATSVSSQDYWVITGAACNVLKKTTATVDFVLQVRQKGGVFRDQVYIPSDVPFVFPVPLIAPKNSDVRILGKASTTNVEVTALISGFLALRQNLT